MIAVYCRRSNDPDDTALSVSHQEQDCRRYAALHWPTLPVEVFVDNDLTAADPNIYRPDYHRMLDHIRSGRVAHVVTREQNRITRQPAEWEQLCTILQLAGHQHVHTVLGGPVSVIEGSRLSGRIVAVVDAEYVEQLRVKARMTHKTLADAGRPTGRVPYGYQRITGPDGRPVQLPDPEQAEVVRRIVLMLAAGWSLQAVADHLDGTPTPRGAPRWTRQSVRAIGKSPTIAGLRIHQGRITGPALWEPLVDRALWEQAQVMLTADHVHTHQGAVKVKRSTGPTRVFLLTGGLSECASCGHPLVASSMSLRSGPVPAYICPHPSKGGGCGKLSVQAEPLEDHVTGVIGGWLQDPAFVTALNDRLSEGQEQAAPLRAELNDIDRGLAELAERWAAGDLLDIEHVSARRVFMRRRSDVFTELATLPPVVEVDGSTLLAAWEHGAVGQRRQVVGVVAHPVRVARGPKRPLPPRVEVLPAWVDR